ncbi:hypothetical protein INR49_005563 [Caranx melampygus]|nr:hypothetical protein INR49_005563 [Caranx melampygus]
MDRPQITAPRIEYPPNLRPDKFKRTKHETVIKNKEVLFADTRQDGSVCNLILYSPHKEEWHAAIMDTYPGTTERRGKNIILKLPENGGTVVIYRSGKILPQSSRPSLLPLTVCYVMFVMAEEASIRPEYGQKENRTTRKERETRKDKKEEMKEEEVQEDQDEEEIQEDQDEEEIQEDQDEEEVQQDQDEEEEEVNAMTAAAEQLTIEESDDSDTKEQPDNRDQDVAVGFQNVSFVGFGSWESHDGAVLLQKAQGHAQENIRLELFGVDALWVVDGSIDLTNAHALGPKPVQVPHGVETHITKAL